ncbi:MAG: hypothetical protein IPP06_16665 [Saprospiraceae bacterium]|nr:hypothetical protein [Candidatus Vicinibacter affinis]MBK7360400.1 hypothetical protein [Saprospiraceae bacterium]MBK8405260.1 hypothetical protein [Candidatus Vicinibacter affinis]MBK8640760.1 hypothetical protein [Candidatus Vicinibacter affinis]MBK9962890.1 hypothetical protein [Candidatus Vicinibacter affinis]
MENQRIIYLEEFRKVIEELSNDTKKEFPTLYFDYAGMIPVDDDGHSRYNCSPLNTTVFARTGGDGVHYSILELSEKAQPIVMTVPMNFSKSINDYNIIISENLNEFLSIGFYNGWFPIEQLCYDNQWAINFYAKENSEEDYQKNADIIFVKKLRNIFGINHIPLNNDRLKELEDKYFHYLQFNSDFMENYIKV